MRGEGEEALEEALEDIDNCRGAFICLCFGVDGGFALPYWGI